MGSCQFSDFHVWLNTCASSTRHVYTVDYHIIDLWFAIQMKMTGTSDIDQENGLSDVIETCRQAKTSFSQTHLVWVCLCIQQHVPFTLVWFNLNDNWFLDKYKTAEIKENWNAPVGRCKMWFEWHFPFSDVMMCEMNGIKQNVKQSSQMSSF